ncbi:MAG: LysR substrate-binding domain-containing protein, partial [Pseudomonadota bacterium]
VSEPWLTEVALFSEAFWLIRPESEAEAAPPSREALREMRLLLLEEGHCFRDQALAFCNIPSAAPRGALDASSLSTLVRMVGAGLGVTLLPEMALATELRATPAHAARLADPEPRRTIGMVWRKSSPLATQLEAIAAALRPSPAQDG